MFFTALNTMIGLVSVIAVGYFCYKKEYIKTQADESLTFILFNIAIPSVMITSFQMEYNKSTITDFLTATLILTVLVFVTLLFGYIFGKLIRFSREKRAVLMYALAFGNVTFFGIPLIQKLFGSSGLMYVISATVPFNILVFALAPTIFGANDTKFNPKQLLQMPIIATCVGFLIYMFQIPLPDFVLTATSIMSNVCVGISLIILGGFFASIPIKDMFNDKAVYLVALLKLLVVPWFSFFIFKGLTLNNTLEMTCVVLASMPTATIVPMTTKKYNGDYMFASKIVFISTLLSIFTMPLVIAVIQKVGL